MAADHWAVVAAAGTGARFGAALPKQYQPLLGRTVLEWSLDALLQHPRVAGASLVLAAGDTRWLGLDYRHPKPVHTTNGGASRAASVLAGLDLLEQVLGGLHNLRRTHLSASRHLLLLRQDPSVRLVGETLLKFGLLGLDDLLDARNKT